MEKWNNAFLDAQRLVTDPPADAVIDRLVAEFGDAKAREVFTLLINNVDIPMDQVPSYVQDYLLSQSVPPAGLDPALIRAGQKVFVDFGPAICLMLYYKSLPTCYLDWKLSETLGITGRLDDTRKWPEVFSRRVGETSQFLLDVMTPGSLEPGGKGIATTLKVRLIHASIRHFVQRSPRFNLAEWQKPINQEDLAYTLLTFGLTMIQGLRQMKLRLSADQEKAFYEAWKLVGHYLGILPEMIPVNIADAEAQQEAMFARLAKGTEANQSITKALLDFSKEVMLPTELLDNSPEFLLRYFMGDEFAAMLGVASKKGCLATILPLAMAKYFGTLEKLEDRGHGLEKLSNILGLAVIRGMVKRFKSVKGRSLQVPEDLAREWGL